uniref:Uncharacterized protein n=1 Tax=Arundo donax TaxID=35708 RepID=A0A0A9A1P0_ARUDO
MGFLFLRENFLTMVSLINRYFQRTERLALGI